MNDFYFFFYQSAMALSLAVLVFLLALVWRRRQYAGAQAMIALIAATLIWTLGFLIESNMSTLEGQLFFNNIGYIGSMSAPVAWFIFARKYSSGDKRPLMWQIALLSIIPVIVIVLVWTNQWHHLMWYNEHLATSGAFTVTAKIYGPVFWIALAYNYILIISGAVFLLMRLFIGAPLYKGQAVALITAVSLPLLWNIIYVFNLVPLPRKDLTPLMFSISGLVIIFGLLRLHLFEIVPLGYKYLMQQMADGIFVFDVRDRLLEVNPSALKIIQMDNSIIGKKMEQLSPLSPLLERLKPVDSRGNEVALSVSGENHVYELETVLMRDNQKRYIGWLAIIHDITPLKQNQEKLQALYEKEQALRQQLDAEVKKRNDFARALVHELKTPLTAIVISSELLDEKLGKEQQSTIIENIKRSADNLNKRISELLDFTQIEAGMLKIQWEDVAAEVFFRQVIAAISPIVANKKQSLILDLPASMPRIRIDKDRIQQVIFNLIDNAVKYNREGGKVILRAEKEKDFLVISVEDTGYGIPVQEQSKLFSPYTRVGVEGRKVVGLGLGLAICKVIVELHGGTIWVESKENKGSVFSFSIPLANNKSNDLIK